MRKLSLTFLTVVAAVELGSVGCAKNESRDTTPASQSGAQTTPNGIGGGPRMQPGMGTDTSGTGNGPNSRTPTDSSGPSGASGTGPSQPGQPNGAGTPPSGPRSATDASGSSSSDSTGSQKGPDTTTPRDRNGSSHPGGAPTP